MKWNNPQCWSLKTRMTLFTLIVFLACIWSLFLYESRMLRDDLTHRVGDQQLSTAAIVATEINNELNRRFVALREAAKVLAPLMSNSATLQASFGQQSVLRYLFNGGALITNLAGTAIADLPQTTGRVGKYYGGDPWISVALHEGKAIVSHPIRGRVLHVPVFAMTVPIRKTRGPILGSLSGVVSLGKSTFLDGIANSSYGESGGFLLVAPQHRLIVTASDKHLVLKDLPAPGGNPVFDHLLESPGGTSVYVDPKGEEVLSSSIVIPATGWRLVLSLPTTEAFAPLNDLQRRRLFATLLLTLIAGCLTWWMMKRQLAPLTSAVGTLAKLFAAAQTVHALPVAREDEVGELIGGFNRLLETLRRREAALHESHETLSSILATTRDGYWRTDRQGRLIEVNQTYLQQSGYTRDELLRMRISELEAVESDSDVSLHIQRIVESGGEQFETRHRRKDGSLWEVEVSTTYHDVNGEEIIAFLRDISERKRNETAVLESERQLKIITDSVPVLIAQYDHNGIYKFVNQPYAEMFGLMPSDIIGKQYREILGEQIYAEAKPHMTAALEGRFGEFERKQLSPQKGFRTFHVSYVPDQDAFGKIVGIIIVQIDITERKLAEEEKQKLEADLMQAQKMEAMGTLAGGIAHNFNNNLAIILGNLELAKLGLDNNAEEIEHLQHAYVAARRASELVRKIMTYSRPGVQVKTPVKVAQIMDETFQLVRSMIPTSIDLICQIPTESLDLTIQAESTRCQEALINLCTNAVHAMDEKGILTISLDMVELLQSDLPVQSKCLAGPYARLSVQDTGCGMTEETIERIFDPFFTTKEVGKGTGIGLSTVLGIVKQHGGLIKVLSYPGKGARFDLYFPLVDEQQPEQKFEKIDLPRGHENICFVDDDEVVALTGAKILESMGYRVTVETNSTLALGRLRRNPNHFDLVITDQTMPKLTGKELTEELNKIRPDLPVILCTGYSSKISPEEAEQLGISAFLVKPLGMTEFLRTVRNVLDESRGICQEA